MNVSLSGERGIRTPGSVTFNGFQDRRIRPLCHLSGRKIRFSGKTTKYIYDIIDKGCRPADIMQFDGLLFAWLFKWMNSPLSLKKIVMLNLWVSPRLFYTSITGWSAATVAG